MHVTPYLNFDGQCAEAFQFYARCLGGAVEMMQTFGDSPMAAHTPPEHHARIMHARLVAGDVVLMGSDSPPGQHEAPRGVWVSLHTESAAEADRVFAALADGGTVTMPIQQTFWAVRFGMLVDRFGIPWMVNCDGE